MKTAKGPRPLSIKLFAAICALAAVIALVRGLLDPMAVQATFWFYAGVMLSRDMAIVAQFSLFTIALIPIIWIYFVASPAARWIVVFFGLVRLWPYAANPSYLPYAAQNDPMELAAPVLQIIAIALLFTSDSRQWFVSRGNHVQTV